MSMQIVFRRLKPGDKPGRGELFIQAPGEGPELATPWPT